MSPSQYRLTVLGTLRLSSFLDLVASFNILRAAEGPLYRSQTDINAAVVNWGREVQQTRGRDEAASLAVGCPTSVS